MNVLALFMLLTISFTTKNHSSTVDGGAPMILAVAQITLHDGKVTEGALTIAKGGYECSYIGNGFVFSKKGKKHRFRLFNMRFSSLQPQRTDLYGLGYTKVQFVEDVSYRCGVYKYEYDAEEDRLNKINREKMGYKMHNTLPLFVDLNEIFGAGQYQAIPVAEIAKIELLKSPSATWEEKIKQAITTQYGAEMLDTPLPVWYHQLLANPSELEALKEYDVVGGFLD